MHVKRLTASKHYPVKRKERTFTTAPRAGPHAKDACIPLRLIVRDVLHLATTSDEVKKILNSGAVKVDGKVRKDARYPVGLMDFIEVPKLNQSYRMIAKSGKLTIVKVGSDRANTKICRINGKTTLKGGKIQINLHDGKNVLVAKDEYKVGDSVVVSLPEVKILKHFKLAEGNVGMITNGKYAGTVGKVTELTILRGAEPNKAVIENANGKVRTLKDYIFVIGKDEAEVSLEDKE